MFPFGFTLEDLKAGVDPLTIRGEAILSLFQNQQRIPFREIHKQMISPISERMLRYELASMRNKGLLRSSGKGRSLVWQKT